MYEPAMISAVHLLHLSLFLLAMLLLQPYVLVAMSTTTRSSLAAGDSLTPPNYITSPSGDFAFGFRALLDSNSSFLLAIWFRFDAGRKVVWFAADAAGSGSAVVVAAGQSVLNLTAAGQLSLLAAAASPSNAALLWSPYTDPSQNYGSLLALRDTGNLQFLAADGTTVVWESFGHPTDTLLPGQVMPPGTLLRSRASDDDDTDYSSTGRFILIVQNDGNIVWYRTDLPGGSSTSSNAYWSTQTCCVANGNTTLFFDAELVGHLYYQLTDGTSRNLTAPQRVPASAAGTGSSFFYQHATLDPDGILRVYILPNNTGGHGGGGNATTWSVVNPPVPSDGCQAVTNGRRGMCGPNSYCVYDADNRLDCECLAGYTFLHTQSRYQGCAPAFLQDTCNNNDHRRTKSHASEFQLVELPNTYWVDTIFYEQHQSVTAAQCQDLCLHNCHCAAALFNGSSNSCLEAPMLTAGWQQNGTSISTLVKVRIRGPPAVILPYAVIAGLGMLFLVTACILLVHCYITNRNARNRKHLSATVFTRKELRRATNGFSKLLGQGGFGKVYHGIVKSLEPHDVAVKELRSGDEYQETEFENEVQSIGRIHHKNLVRMVGYCKEGVHRMLVFEFMPGGSLGDVLFKPSGERRPSWSWRAEAAVAIARGLEYLHYGCTAQIVHCDIKPDNILLDDRRIPKITDFGIARLLDGDKLKQTITHVRGTLGYLAPEWFSSERKVDSKVDVFSFGVVLLEMICCRKHPPPPPPPAPAPADDGGQDGPRCSDDDDDSEEDIGMPVTLRAWVSDLVREGEVWRAVQGDKEALQDLERVERFARIASWCVQGEPSMRPTMRSVVWMMEGAMEVDVLLPADDPPAPRRVHDFSAAAGSSGTHDDNSNSNSSSIYMTVIEDC
jgi:serine/threonine protein kinase